MTSDAITQADRDVVANFMGAIFESGLPTQTILETLEQAFARHRTASLAAAINEWEQSGEMPEWDSPLRDVFDAGVTYAIERLAEVAGVASWEAADGSDDYDGDIMGTMRNILAEARP